MRQPAKVSDKALPALLLCCLFIYSSYQADAAAITLAETPKLVPPETTLLLDIKNFSQFETQFETTNPYKLYKDPAMKPFIEDLKNKLTEKARTNNILDAVINSDTLPQGKVAFAQVLNQKAIDANEPMALFITQWGKNIEEITQAVDKTIESATEQDSYLKTEEYRGVTIKTVTTKDSSRLGFGFCSTLSFCFIDDCLLGSEDTELLRFTIAHIQGATSPTLADDSDYTATIAQTGPYHDADLYINLKHIIKTAITQDTTGRARANIINLGLDNIAAFGFSLELGRHTDSPICGKALLRINGPKKGICKILATEPGVLRAPAFLPATVCSALFINLDIKKEYDELYKIIYKISPVYAAVMYSALLKGGPGGRPPLLVKDDIVDHLGSQIIFAQSLDKPFDNNPKPVQNIFAITVNDRSDLEKSMSLWHSNKFPDSGRELLGYTIYPLRISLLREVLPPSQRTPMQSPPVQTTQSERTDAFTITDTHVIFGSEPAVENAIRTISSNKAASLNSANWFGRTKSVIPAATGIAALQNGESSTELLFWALKTKTNRTALNILASPNPMWIFSETGLMMGILSYIEPDFDLLPDFDSVRKYFGPSVFYCTARPDGFFLELKYLNHTDTD